MVKRKRSNRPESPTMQERIDRQANEWLERQPRILSGLDDYRTLERLASAKDEKGMKTFLDERARIAKQSLFTKSQKFFRLQSRRGRRPEPWVEEAARMWMLGKSWNQIAEWRRSNGDTGATKESVCKAVKDYRRRPPR